MALFYVNKQEDLIPVAIQLFQEPAEDNPVNPAFPSWESIEEAIYLLTFTALVFKAIAPYI